MGRVFISHSAKEDAASAALDELSTRLKDAGHTVLLDREHLKVNMPWRQEIHTWMALCHATVVLFSPSALTSDWVKKEATITSWRRSLDPAFVFIPVLIPPVRRADLEANGFGPLALGEIQFGPPSAIDEIVDRLSELINVVPETPMEGWITKLSLVLAEVERRSPEVLRAAAAAAGVDLPWDPALSDSDRLARRLLHAGPEAISTVIERFANVLPSYEKALGEMVEVLVPAWVDPVAVAEVPGVAGRPAPPRTIVINGTESWVGETYVKRAGCGTRRWEIVQANNVGGEDADQQVDRIVDEILESARGPVRLGSEATLQAVLDQVMKLSVRNRFFAIIPFGLTLTTDQVVALQERLQPFTLVLLTGLDPQLTMVRESNAVVLSPMLADKDESNAATWIEDLRFLARPTV